MSLLGLLIFLLVLSVLFGGWGSGHAGWGYAGWSPLGILVVVVLILLLVGVVHAEEVGMMGLVSVPLLFGMTMPTSSGTVQLEDDQAGPPGLPYAVSYWLGWLITGLLAVIGYFQGQWIEGHGADTGLTPQQFAMMCAFATFLGVLGRALPNVQHTPKLRQRELLHAAGGTLPRDLKHLRAGGEPPAH